MNDGSHWNKHVNRKIQRNCVSCGARRTSANNARRLCAKCWRKQ